VTRLVVVEDEHLYRDLLRIALGSQPGFEVVGAYADGETALAEAPALRPDVAVLDFNLAGQMNGVQLGVRLRRQLPGIGIVLLSNHELRQFIAYLPTDALGGWAYLFKRSVGDAQTLVRAVAGAASGVMVLDPRLVGALQPKPSGALANLTPRQLEILALVAQGYTNAAIAERLVLSEATVEKQTNLLYQRLDVARKGAAVHSRVQAVLIYLRESRVVGDTATAPV
jgi:DNA-binding NarL/FixJ family response regulator